ncbi:hypothetical protein RLOatenuis_0410 [Rickettsiales bacterium]|nr:hypothetical protein RLOatenuis_0410 [Rickettsiales bacterium]
MTLDVYVKSANGTYKVLDFSNTQENEEHTRYVYDFSKITIDPAQAHPKLGCIAAKKRSPIENFDILHVDEIDHLFVGSDLSAQQQFQQDCHEALKVLQETKCPVEIDS